jgi:hypothetical protein
MVGCGPGQGKQGGQWAEFLWGLIVGLELALASYAFGEQCAMIIDRYLVPGGAVDTALEGMQAQCAFSPCTTNVSCMRHMRMNAGRIHMLYPGRHD